MKIIHIAVHLGGGVGKAIAGMAIQCKNRIEQKIILLEPPCDMSYFERLNEEGIKVLITPPMDCLKKSIMEADLVILNWWGHPKMVHFLLDFPQIPCRLVIWNHINGCTYPYLTFDFLNTFMHVFFTSEYSYETLLWTQKERAVMKGKSSVVYGIGDFLPERVEPKKNYDIEGKFKIGYVGTLNYAKLFTGFLEYYRELIKEFPNIQFIMLGRVDAEILDDIRKRGIEQYFIFPGFVDNPEEYYRDFDVFLYLLNSENYATTENALLEAMAYRLPIIVFNHPMERNIVHEGKNGFLINTKEELVEYVHNLYQSKQLRGEIGKKSREYVIEHYNGTDNATLFINECEKTLGTKKRIFCFKRELGENPFEMFCTLSGREGKIFQRYIVDPNEQNTNAVKNVNQIFKGKGKGSIYQYSDCFPQGWQFRKIIDCWKE